MSEKTAAFEWRGIAIPNSHFLGTEIVAKLQADEYEKEELEGALAVVKDGDRILEVGAGLGIVGTFIGSRKKISKHLAFEANPELIPSINSIYHLNGLDQTHEVRNALLMSEPNPPDVLQFHVHKSFLGSSMSKSEAHTKYSVDIPTEDLVDVQKDFQADILLMDIEGAERIFLKHANLADVRAIIVEFHPEHYGIVGSWVCKYRLLKAGFRPIPSVSTGNVWTCERR